MLGLRIDHLALDELALAVAIAISSTSVDGWTIIVCPFFVLNGLVNFSLRKGPKGILYDLREDFTVFGLTFVTAYSMQFVATLGSQPPVFSSKRDRLIISFAASCIAIKMCRSLKLRRLLVRLSTPTVQPGICLMTISCVSTLVSTFLKTTDIERHVV
jgi:hypothetical protein